MSEKKYVCRLRKAKCDCGTMENYLNVEKDHGIVWEKECDPGEAWENKQPFMNANDMEPKKNIIHFGRCNSDSNPGNEFDLEEAVMGVLLPGSTIIKNLIGCGGCKCKPVIVQAWQLGADSHLVEGAPCLTDESTVFCRNGGFIEIVEVEEEDNGESSTHTSSSGEEHGGGGGGSF